MKVNKKYTPYLFALLMGVSMGLVMSFSMTALNSGFTQDFLARWLKSFIGGITIGIPTAIMVSSPINRFIGKITH